MRWGLALVAAGAMSIGSTHASDGGPLVDALVKKGVLSAQEGEEIRVEMQEAYMGTGGGMLQWGNSAVKGVKLYGDVRMRYQWEDTINDNGASGRDRSRIRYRARIGAEYQFSDNFRAGIRGSTNVGENSTNVTLAGFGAGGQGNNDGLYLDLWYLTYENDDIFESGLVDSVEFTMGKFALKDRILIDKAFWDGDVNPEGFYQSVGWDDIIVDGLDVKFNAAQLILNGTERERSGSTTAANSIDFLFVQELNLSYENFTIAPQFWVSTENAQNQASFDTGTANFNSFMAFMVPAKYKFKAFGQSHALKATYGVNVAESEANQLFQVGYQLNKAKKKGSWQLGIDYRYLEAQAWDDNIVDSDFYSINGNVGAHGFKLGGKYAVTDNILFGVSYYYSQGLSDQPTVLGGAAGGGTGTTEQLGSSKLI